MKFIKIWQYNEMLQQEAKKAEMAVEEEIRVGPGDFIPLMKLGQGSFG